MSDLKFLNGKKLFISGGTGFIGKNLLKYLMDYNLNPQRLTILTRDKNKFKAQHPELQVNWLDYHVADIREFKYKNDDYDYFIHAAASVIDQKSPLILYDEIVNGTRNALNFAAMAKVKAFINISSGAVYSKNSQLHGLCENSSLISEIEDERSTYGLAKIAAEHLSFLVSNNSGMKVLSLRCFCFAGPYLDAKHFAIGEFIKKAMRNENINVCAGKNIYRSYLHAEEMAAQIFAMLNHSISMQKTYNVFNLGSSESTSLCELSQLVVKTLNSKSQVFMPNFNDEMVNYYVPNVAKISKAIQVKYLPLSDVILSCADFD